MNFTHIDSDKNFADIQNKQVLGLQFCKLVQPLLFHIPPN